METVDMETGMGREALKALLQQLEEQLRGVKAHWKQEIRRLNKELEEARSYKKAAIGDLEVEIMRVRGELKREEEQEQEAEAEAAHELKREVIAALRLDEKPAGYDDFDDPFGSL